QFSPAMKFFAKGGRELNLQEATQIARAQGSASRVAGRVGDGMAIAGATLLGAAPAEGQEANPSSEIQGVSNRISQLETDIIPNFEADLSRLSEGGSSPERIKEIQQFLNFRLGSNLTVDGALGGRTSEAIRNYRTEIEGLLNNARNELQTARTRRDELEFLAAQSDAPSSNAAFAKAGPLAAALGGVALSTLARGRGVQASKKRALDVEARANAMISPRPIKKPGESTNALARRASNVNEFWRQGGAGDNVPFKQTPSGEWRPRAKPLEPSQLFKPKGTMYTSTDVGIAAGGLSEAALVQPLVVKAEERVEEARANVESYAQDKNAAGYLQAKQELADAEDYYAAVQTIQRLGYGIALGAAVSPIKMKNASPRPDIARAEADVALVRGAVKQRRDEATN
ncbi:MAG: hypothetical protein AAGH48_05445, partial [Pseudomonadota bacterium]